MSPRVVVASALLTVLLAGGAIFFLATGEEGSWANGNDPSSAAEAAGSDRGTVPTTGSGGSTRTGGAGGDRDGDLVGRVGQNGKVVPPDWDGRPGSEDDPTGSAHRAADGSTRPLDGTEGSRGSGGAFLSAGGSPRGGETSDTRAGNGFEDPEPAPDSITIHGSIIAVDPDGGRFPEESGTIGIRVTAPGLDELRDIAVVAGEWRAPVPDRAQVRFETAQLGERPARVTPGGPMIASDQMSLALLGEWTSQTLLHVRSRATGESLCDLELVRVPDWMRNSRPHPGVVIATDHLQVAECSPLPLVADGPGSGSSVPYHVRSPGFAWGRILLDTAAGGDREILLDAGGGFDIAFSGGWQRPGALLRLRILGETQPYAEVAVQGETMRVEGIHPGQYEVSVETGSWAQHPLVLGTLETTVQAGVITLIELDVIDIVDEDRVPFAGTVFVPSTWTLDEFQLRIRPIDPGTNANEETQHIPSLEMTATPVGGGTLYGWEADAVIAGNFGVLILPIGYGVNFSVGPEGNLGAALALPDAAPVEIVTLLAGTEDPATPSMIRWTPARDAGVPGAGALSAMPEGPANYFVFDAPVGSVILSCSDGAYRPASREIEVTLEGPNVFTLELEPAHGIHVLLFDESTSVPWDIGWHANLTPVEGTTGQVVTRGRIGIRYRILVSQPGWYTLTVPAIDGFLPVPPLEVEVLEGLISDVPVDLVREP